MKQLRKVEVEWIDSAFDRGWASNRRKREDMQIAHCRTAGFLLGKDDKAVHVVLSVSGDVDGDSADGISIPVVAIRRMRYLK